MLAQLHGATRLCRAAWGDGAARPDSGLGDLEELLAADVQVTPEASFPLGIRTARRHCQPPSHPSTLGARVNFLWSDQVSGGPRGCLQSEAEPSHLRDWALGVGAAVLSARGVRLLNQRHEHSHLRPRVLKLLSAVLLLPRQRPADCGLRDSPVRSSTEKTAAIDLSWHL